MNYTVQLSQLSPPKFWVVTSWPQADAGCLGVCVVKDMDLGCQLRQLGRLLTAMEASNLESSRFKDCDVFFAFDMATFSGTLR